MDIAISGISGRFPSSEDLEQFKDNLFKGVDLITEDKHRWPPGMFGLPPRNGILSSMDKFDAEFFGFTDTQAEIMEPTERMCYELTTEALYDAGIDPKCIRGQGSRWGIYHGSCFTFVSNKFSDPELVPTFVPRDLCRLSRHLGVTGQLFHSDTACASGLTAFNEAVFALKSQMIDYAIVLGYNALLKSRVSIGFKKMRMISPDGKCKCHDESADGYVRSEAAVVLILQRYNTNPKRIYAKILASKANSDGYKQQGVTFPSVDGQCDLLDITYKSIGLDPSCINYVEAHVTGTQAGDVVESNALHEFFFNRHRRRAPLMLGCLKSSMGHSEGASGLCSLAKALIVHQARKIPQNLHLKTPNSKIPPLLSGELKPITEITELNDSLIAVNCFGFGGSNVHVITERHDTDGQKSCTFPRLVPACGRTQEALDHMVTAIASATDYLEDGFLSLVQGYAMQPADGMPWRGCLLVSSYKDIKRMPPLRCFPNKKKLVLHVKDNARINDADVTVLLKTFPQFAKSMRMLQNTLTKELLSHDSKHHEGLSRKMQSVLICLSLVNLIKSLQIRFDKFYASGLNVLLGAYIENQLSGPEIVEITCAYLCNQDNKADLVKSLEKVYQSRTKKWPNVQILIAAIEEPTLALNGHHSKDVVLSMSASGIQVGRSVHSCPAEATLEAIGQVYIAGHHVNFEALYAKPAGPLPTSTPFFSPLVKWKHEKTYSLVHYIGDESNNFYYRTSKSIDFEFEHSNALDTFVYDHVIDGRKLFPATGYLMLAWYTLAETIKKNPLDLIVRWSNVRYNRATVLNEKSKTRITVRINDATNSFEVIEGFQAIVTGFIQVLEQPTGNKMLLPHTEQPVFLDSTAMYRELRVRGYDYAPFFQGIQSVTSDGSAGRVAWRQVAPKLVLESLQQSTDSSTLWLRAFVPFADSLLQLQLLNKRNNHRCLVVPTSIDEIICDPRQLMVHIDSSDKFVDKATDLLTPQLDGWYDDDTNTVFTRGLLIKGLKASAISRRKQDPVVHTYSFVPYLDSTVYDEIPFNHLVDIVVGNLVSGSSRLSIKIIEFHSCGNPLANGIIEAIKSNVLASTIDVDYVLETETEPTNISSGVRIVKSSLTLREEANSKDFVIISSQDQYFHHVIQSLKTPTFVAAIGYLETIPSGMVKVCHKNTKTTNVVLLRTTQEDNTEQVQVEIDTGKVDDWLSHLKDLMQSTEMKKVWLTCCNRDPSAIYGLAKTLRLEENGHRIRLLVDSLVTGRSVDIRDKKYADILRDDLVYNVCNAESHGFFTHQSLKTEDTKDTNYYLRIARPGDLSSFTWTQSSVQSSTGRELISVKFAALNFRDVMFASGKLSGDAVPFVNPLVVQDSLLGLEFAGISEDGRRVMGVVPAKALANKIAVSKNPDDRLVLDVPDTWTLEEASTIPAVYMTVYYALFIRAQLRPGESVLIHSAAGGVGLAAINVCLALRCHLFLTVGTQEKRDFLLSEFPTLDPSAIFDSRSTVFEDDIQKATGGKGVDVILNSLANEKLSAGLRCLSHNGRFLELGKVDFMSNSVLDISSLGHNQSFHGILLDIFAVEGSVVSESVVRVRKQLLSMLRKDIDSGIIKPLPRTIYRRDRIEDAFRFMATGQHVGKVVIDMSSSGPEMGTVKQSTHFDCAKSYLIVGGLGGFGLELASWLVVKGAKNIVLNGRSGIRTPYQRYTLERLQQDGARVEVSVENCTLLDGAKNVLNNCLKLGPLGGIFNAAVVLKDALLSNLTTADFNDAMDPKSRVTENLDSLTSQCSTLDHFVCFSSLSTGRGNQGQANYNLANGAMEAICRRRRESGLAGLAVQWGVIGDVGLIADKSLNASQVASKGFSPQRIPSCLEVLDHLMARNDAVVTSYVSASPETIGAEGPTDIFKMVSSVMGIKDLATVDPTATLGKLGIDSLITVEIKQLIERSLNVSYSLKQVRDLTVSDLLSLASAKKSS